MPETDVIDNLAAALIEVAKVRFAAFRNRFGRDPKPHEPLLFDPSADEPVAANRADRMQQILTAANASNVDPRLVLKLLGYGYLQ